VGDELRVLNRRIASGDPPATAALDRALNALFWTASSFTLMAPVLLPRRARHPLLGYAAKLSTVSASVFADSHVLVVLVDPEGRAGPPLHSPFALTPAEGRLAIRLASGMPIETADEDLRIVKGDRAPPA
jgi:hypothetical protein